jgi:transcriptional regulator with XRE-family HTH domain
VALGARGADLACGADGKDAHVKPSSGVTGRKLPEVDDVTAELRNALGRRLLDLRGQAELSLRDAAATSGLSPTFISLVERGMTEIGLSRLISLADAYGATIPDLLSEIHSPDTVELVPADKGFRAPRSSGEPLTTYLSSPSWRLQPFRIELHAGARMEPVSHAGEEFVHCVEGNVVMVIDDERYELACGDSLTLPPYAVHSYDNPHPEPATCVGAVLPANRPAPRPHRGGENAVPRSAGREPARAPSGRRGGGR